MNQLRRNAIYNVLGWLVPTLIFVGLTPVMINRLGIEAFGIISLIQIITTYMNVLNFGFSEAITKQVAESHGRDADQAARVVWVGLWLFAGFGALGAVVLFTASGWLAHDLFKIEPELRDDAAIALKIGAPVFFFQMLAEFYRGTSIGCQRFDVPNLSRILRISLSALFILWALHAEAGITGVLWATLAGLLSGLVVNALWMERVLPLRMPTGALRTVWVDVFHFSKHMFLSRIAGLVASRLAQLFLGTLSSAANVALYEVPTRAAETGSVMLNRVLQVFFPSFSAMDRKTELERIRSVFTSAFSLQVLVTAPFFLCVVLEGANVLAFWINPVFARDAAPIILLVSLTYWLSSLTNLPVFLALSFGRPDLISKYSIIRMVITLVVGYPLVLHFGLIGAALTMLISELTGPFFIGEAVRQALGHSTLAQIAKPALVHFLIAAGLYLGYEFVFRASALYSPWWLLVVPALHIGLAVLFGTARAEDRQRLYRLVFRWR